MAINMEQDKTDCSICGQTVVGLTEGLLKEVNAHQSVNFFSRLHEILSDVSQNGKLQKLRDLKMCRPHYFQIWQESRVSCVRATHRFYSWSCLFLLFVSSDLLSFCPVNVIRQIDVLYVHQVLLI